MRRGSAVVVFVATLALLLGACDDDGAGTEGGASDSTGGQAEASTLPEPLAQRLRSEVLIEQQGLTTSEANCAIEQLGETLSADQVAEAEDAADLPPDVTGAAFDAGVRCAGK